MGHTRLTDAPGAGRARRRLAATALAAVICLGGPAAEAESQRSVLDPAEAELQTLVLDPAAARIVFTLGATLHNVEGTIPLTSGEIRFDGNGGPASGRITLDARGATTGLDARDAAMHERVLQSHRYPEIHFDVASVDPVEPVEPVDRVEPVEPVDRAESSERSGQRARIRLTGVIHLLGRQHDSSWVLDVERVEGSGERVRAWGEGRVPYVAWGLEDVSNFVLRVEDFVEVSLEVEGTVSRSSR